MEERLQWIKRRSPGLDRLGTGARGPGGRTRWSRSVYPQARSYAVEPQPARAAVAKGAAGQALVERLAGGGAVEIGPVPAGAVQMLWSNMQLHMAGDPEALMRQWQEALAVDGFLMFSCLGPDTT
jgi:malonyl-CoA O-methyltransferase